MNEEELVKLLKSIIACVSNGDYYSIKELCMIELKKLEDKKKDKK